MLLTSPPFLKYASLVAVDTTLFRIPILLASPTKSSQEPI